GGAAGGGSSRWPRVWRRAGWTTERWASPARWPRRPWPTRSCARPRRPRAWPGSPPRATWGTETPTPVRRRRFLQQLLGAPGVIAAARALDRAPAILRADAGRPAVTHGVASGDVTFDRAIVWSRANRAARLVVQWDTTESFRSPRTVRGPAATEETGFTARVDLTGLPAGQRIVYRVRFEDLADARAISEPATGTPRTA